MENLQDKDDLLLRPQKFEEYVGQDKIKEMLKVFIDGALNRDESLDHVLLFGPPGLGKTTLAYIIANELHRPIKATSAPAIRRVGDLAAILSSLEEGEILFIDEIHRLPKVVEEVLYQAMEDFQINILLGKDQTASPISLTLAPFTLIGATTRTGDISSPLRDRFGIINQIEFYTPNELKQIVLRTAKVYDFSIEEEAALEIGKRSRGTPRIANRLFRRIRDFAQFRDKEAKKILLKDVSGGLQKLAIDKLGLSDIDIRYLKTLRENFSNNPAGVKAIAASLGEDPVTLEDFYEPFLLQAGLIVITSRGRMLTEKALNHLKELYESK